MRSVKSKHVRRSHPTRFPELVSGSVGFLGNGLEVLDVGILHRGHIIHHDLNKVNKRRPSPAAVPVQTRGIEEEKEEKLFALEPFLLFIE